MALHAHALRSLPMGGKPSKGTRKDKRLGGNKPKPAK